PPYTLFPYTTLFRSKRKYFLSSRLIGISLTSILSEEDTFVPSSLTTLPLTLTLPSFIISSAFLRDVIPACAITFCKRSIYFTSIFIILHLLFELLLKLFKIQRNNTLYA